MDKFFTINEIVKWYDKNVNFKISSDFIVYLVTNNIILPKEPTIYSLNSVNDFLLEKLNNEYVKDRNGRFKIKENRKKIVEKYKGKPTVHTKFKIASLDGNKLKLIKLS